MAQFDSQIDIQLNNAVFDNLKLDVEYTFYAQYSASILKGFYYRSLRRHPEWNYVEQTLDRFDFEDEMAKDLAQGRGMEAAVTATAERLKAAFEATLQRAPERTLNWWIEKHEPWKYVKMEIGKDIPESSYG